MTRRFLISFIFRQQMFILALLQQIIVFKRTVKEAEDPQLGSPLLDSA